MKKIPTLLVRDAEDRSKVTHEVNPACQWVIDGEGVPHRKIDGTCVMFDGGRWFARREVKRGKAVPLHYYPIETDPVTGKTVGWEPIEQSSFYKFFQEALNAELEEQSYWGNIASMPVGTYELIGPKINGNPENTEQHMLVEHATIGGYDTLKNKRDVESIINEVIEVGEEGWEGIVWHHPDGRMAKLKYRDVKDMKS